MSPASITNRPKLEASKSTAELSSERTGYVPPHLRHSISATPALPGRSTLIPKTSTLKGSMNVNASMLSRDQDNHDLRHSDHKDYLKYHNKLPANDVSMQPHKTDESSTTVWR